MTEPVQPAWSERFGRPRVAVLVPVAVLVTVVAWGAAASLGGMRPGGGRAADPPPAAAPGTSVGPVVNGPGASGAGRLPLATQFGPPLTGHVLARGDGLRALDLGTGNVGEPLGPTDWSSQVHAAPDGSLWCVCAARSNAGGGFMLELRIAGIDAGGRVARGDDAPVLGRWIGAREPNVAADLQGESVWSTSALSPDGSLALVGVTVRNPPVWQRHVVVVDLRARRVAQTIDLPETASRDGTRVVHAWAPSFSFAPDGRTVAIRATTVEADVADRLDTWLAPIDGGALGALRPLEAFEAADCPGQGPAFASATVLYAVCLPDAGRERVLRRYAFDGARLADTDLTGVLDGGFPSELVDGARGRIHLWDPFAWRGVSIDAATGGIVGQIDVPREASTSAVPEPLGALAAALSELVAPGAAAKVLVEPALALSKDGSRLYAVGLAAREQEGGFVVALDATDGLSIVERWTVTSHPAGIALGPDGTIVLSIHPVFDAAGARIAYGGLTVIDATTGRLRAVIELDGDVPLQLVDATWEPTERR